MLSVYGDCQITVYQASGKYKVRNETLRELHYLIDDALDYFEVRCVEGMEYWIQCMCNL